MKPRMPSSRHNRLRHDRRFAMNEAAQPSKAFQSAILPPVSWLTWGVLTAAIRRLGASIAAGLRKIEGANVPTNPPVRPIAASPDADFCLAAGVDINLPVAAVRNGVFSLRSSGRCCSRLTTYTKEIVRRLL